MTIKKVLLVPNAKIIEVGGAARRDPWLTRLRKTAYEMRYGRKLVYNQELLYYADIPKILGTGNVFVLGRMRPHLHIAEVPRNCAYPSFHGTPKATFIEQRELDAVLKQVDVAIVSRISPMRDTVTRAARAHDVPVALVDGANDEGAYGSATYATDLLHGCERGRDFDVYFKADLLLGYATDTVLPLVPTPVRAENYRYETLPKDIDIFFSGRLRDDRNQPERGETVKMVRDNFPNAQVLEPTSAATLLTPEEYAARVSRSRMALCPSGRVWDSWRFGEVGLAPQTVLVAPVPYNETVGPPLKDGVNAILYDVDLRGGRAYLRSAAALREKIAHYLARPAELARMADTWSASVREGHTITARSRSVIERLERAL